MFRKTTKKQEVMTMKKLVLAMAVLGMIAMFGCKEARGEEPAAEFRFPGWRCTDAEVLQAQLALAPDDGMKIVLTYMIDFAQNGVPATFADACARIDTAITAVNPDYYADGRTSLKKQYAYCTGNFTSEAIAYCKANPGTNDFYLAIKEKTEWSYVTVSESLLKYKYSPAVALQAVDYLNRQAIALDKDDAEVLGLLKKLNRVFSALLTTDQAAWEKVVAQVRTLMETYE